MRFRDLFSLKHILFAVVLVGLMMLFAVSHSNNMVKVKFREESIRISSSKYKITMEFEDIVSVALEDLAEPGQEKENCFDDEMLRTGLWENDAWGRYYVCADLDTTKCIVARLHDGRVFVFSCKNDAKTEQIYNDLLSKLNG